MKDMKQWFWVACALLAAFLWMGGTAAAQNEDHRSLSPYFFVHGDDEATDRMPLKSTSAAVMIAGVMADVTVTQIYKNEGVRPIEAVYIFPASARAAVYGMKMTIGRRVVEAEISRRDEARRMYEQARDAGKNASLLEQHRPNVFQMNVANIMPGDEVRVELRYTEILVPTDRVYEFVYPTVVGPRYAGSKTQDTPGAPGWASNPYLRQGEVSATTFNVTVAIHAGMPLKDVICPSHKVNTTFTSDSEARVSLDQTEAHGGNRDYILRYRLAGDQIASGLLLSQGEKENFFVLMMQPPKKIATADIPGREYIFIVDVSGSMHGFPLTVSKKLLADLIGNLRSTDRFNVLLFSGSSSLLAEESLPASQANIRQAISVIDRQQGGGQTELLPALKRALALKRPEEYSRSIVVVTDGYVTVEEEAFDLIRKNLGEASLFAFGIGSAVNRHLIEGMARVGMGEPFVLTNPDRAGVEAGRFRSMIAQPVLTRVKVRFKGFDVYDVEPMAIPDVLADRPVMVFGKWRGRPVGKITVGGISGAGRYEESLSVEHYSPSKDHAALKYIWARHRIALLSDYNSLRHDDRRVEEVTKLGLAYHLLTAYTSFVAVDSEVRHFDGRWVQVKQPLPLPDGVSDFAVGGAPAVPTAQMIRGYRAKTQSFESADLPAAREYVADEKKGEAGRLQILSVTVSKGLSRDKFSYALQKQLGETGKCAAGMKISGQVVVHLTIHPDGTVKTAKLGGRHIKDRVFRQCILDQVKGWFFEAVADGKEAQATVVFKAG